MDSESMFTGLRTRLFASYILIITVTLLVIGIALFLVMRARPLLTETTSLRLYNLMSQISLIQEERGIAVSISGPTRLQRQMLNQIDKRLNVRVLLTDANGVVSYDSRRIYQENTSVEMDAKPYVPPTAPESAPPPLIRGMLHNPDGSEWLFVAQTPPANLASTDSSSSPQQFFMVAIRAPRSLDITETLQYYGQDLLTPLYQAGLIGLVVAFILSLIITRSVAQPLQDVAKAAASAANGNLDIKAPVRGPREVRIVAEAFNHMTEQVQQTREAQRDFLANVTHDLRTPLTSIQGFSQAIIDGVASNPSAAQRAAQIIYEEAGRLNRMVQELLDLARIEAGRFSMTQHSIHLTELLNALGERIAPRAAENGLTLKLNVPPLPTIAGDGDRLVQVYTNLVDNALKHTPQGGTVTLRAIVYNNGVLVQVRDTGEGIPAADLPHIFDRFYQVDKSRQRGRRDGVGLGLTITKGIVEAHGGRLWVESQDGVGTTFSTWFPAVASDASTISIRRRSGIFKNLAPKPTPAEEPQPQPMDR
ncbi:MAG: ATP-binding protein [Chloroflexota bacterium]